MAWMFNRQRPNLRLLRKKQHNEEDETLLERLEQFLRDNELPIMMLSSFWEGQRNAITYQALRTMVETGFLDGATLNQWQQDYVRLVTEEMPRTWGNAIMTGAASQPVMENIAADFVFDPTKPAALDWVQRRAAQLVTNCTEEQKNAIAVLLEDQVRNRHSVDELAKLIRPCIGLTKGQTAAVQRYYDNLLKELTEQHPRTSPEKLQERARKKAEKYAERLHRQRAQTIAQTEMAYAYNFGAHEAARQAQEQGLLGKCVKKWNTSGDDRVCQKCKDLDGKEVGMEERFFQANLAAYPDAGLFPPLHPRCACAVKYVEVEPPVFKPSGIRQDTTQPDAYRQTTFQPFEENSGLTLLSQDGILETEIAELPVTAESIDAISLVQPEGWTMEQAEVLQEAHRELLRMVQGILVGTEAYRLYTPSMEFLKSDYGELGAREVHIPKLAYPYIAMHNHPDGLTFSEDDIESFILNPHLCVAAAVGNDGSVHIIEKSDGALMADFAKAFSRIRTDYPHMMDSPEAYDKAMRDFLKGCAKYGIRYYERRP